jgi:hypothetical protein
MKYSCGAWQTHGPRTCFMVPCLQLDCLPCLHRAQVRELADLQLRSLPAKGVEPEKGEHNIDIYYRALLLPCSLITSARQSKHNNSSTRSARPLSFARWMVLRCRQKKL